MRPANPQRGEVRAIIDGEAQILRLSLGSLAELEAALEVRSITALAERFEAGQPAAQDVMEIIAAGLRGGGRDVAAREVAAMGFEKGALGAYRLAAELLAAAFGPTSE